MTSDVTLSRKLAAEAVGTALLLATVVGSAIMGHRLSGGNVAIALLANTLATGGALIALIFAFAPISGAHFNPVVTLSEVAAKNLSWSAASGMMAAQLIGAVSGVVCAHLMFGEPVISLSTHERSGLAMGFSEFVATFGLMVVIFGVARSRPEAVPFAVGAYIIAGYWFTASSCFANPAVTLSRMLTDTPAGIRPLDAPGFLVGELAGAGAAIALFRWLTPSRR